MKHTENLLELEMKLELKAWIEARLEGLHIVLLSSEKLEGKKLEKIWIHSIWIGFSID